MQSIPNLSHCFQSFKMNPHLLPTTPFRSIILVFKLLSAISVKYIEWTRRVWTPEKKHPHFGHFVKSSSLFVGVFPCTSSTILCKMAIMPGTMSSSSSSNHCDLLWLGGWVGLSLLRFPSQMHGTWFTIHGDGDRHAFTFLNNVASNLYKWFMGYNKNMLTTFFACTFFDLLSPIVYFSFLDRRFIQLLLANAQRETFWDIH